MYLISANFRPRSKDNTSLKLSVYHQELAIELKTAVSTLFSQELNLEKKELLKQGLIRKF
ncbi:hypothetical protein ADICYQ_4388 [Cyclobacterium qasimii M12-11B]|uniref:Uncharacterized protein n=1 Tax=Cyclobacterium qasimii M12-11B TaxID=641524 RepID=S7V9L5_9BACT|nr:hypothetical protein ADICYQ_4388 [Cyclobacterium qasimii M12-11B]